MEYREYTPPTMLELHDYDLQCPGGSASTVDSCFPDWSPETAMTAATTPPKSPVKIRELGPTLLPRVRPQDQVMEVSTALSYYGHGRTASMPASNYSTQFGGHLHYRPGFERRSTSPPGQPQYTTPASAPSPFDHMINDQASVRRPSMANMRSVSTSNIRTHSRNTSSSSIDASMLSRYGYPTYRQSPTPQPVVPSIPMSRTPSAMSHLAPIAMPGGQMQSYPQRKRTASPPANPSRLSTEVAYDPVMDLETTTMAAYLTSPNPTPSLVQRRVRPLRERTMHAWFDIRNVTSWTDFDVSAIASVPEIYKLVTEIDIGRGMLPQPGRVNMNPETPAQLAETLAMHHAVKVNAALKVSQGETHMAMRSLKHIAGSREQPEFVSNYQSDSEKTIYGDGRGRVIGIVKCWDEWNSGMRNGTRGEPVSYLRGLAQLQRFMREHDTRYGFIMTETELVCVRAGGPPNEKTTKPLFGFVEVAKPIEIATSGIDDNSNLRLTADLALWWLHMLARDQPFPGQYHWRMNVGPPGDLSRQNTLPERDSWMPKLNLNDKREAKRARGWVDPKDPLHKRECGKTKRSRNSESLGTK